MSLEISGTIHEKYDTQVVSEKFKKREFILAITEEINDKTYTNYAKFQLVQAKCDLLDRFKVGDEIKVSFNIKGNKWERDGKVNYISNLDAWRLESVGNNQQTAPAQQAQPERKEYSAPGSNYPTPTDNFQDLPF